MEEKEKISGISCNEDHWILNELTYPSKQEIRTLTLREKAWLLFEDPTSSNHAYFLSISIMTMIVISGITFLIETIPGNNLENNSFMHILEIFFVICFTIEYMMRFIACPNKKEFIFSFLNLIDLFAFLPFYIEQIVPNSASATPILRVVRLTRVFRIMKVSKYVTWIKVFNSAISRSIRPLAMLLYIMFIGIVLCSTAIYFIEKDVKNPFTKQYPFKSIPSSFWWSIITMTTVGYGDAVPQTTIGKLIGGITSLCGILVLALPITVISNNFNQEMEKMNRVQEHPVKSIQTLRKLLNKKYKHLLKEKIQNKKKQQNHQRSSIGITQKVHSKIEQTNYNKQHSLEMEKKRANSFHGSLPPNKEDCHKDDCHNNDCHKGDDSLSEIALQSEESLKQSGSVGLSPKAKTKLNDLLFNIDTGNIQIVSNDNQHNMKYNDKSGSKLLKNKQSVDIKRVNTLAPYLSSEDIRGILAMHIVEQICTLIEKEEKILKRKLNDLIRKQFDFLLSDLSRIFSEVPHFQGLNGFE